LLDADSSIAAFPRWYRVSKDTTVEMTYTDFVFSDEVAHRTDPEALQTFLAGGSRPIVFTAGTAARREQDFFAAAAEACERLSIRAIFLSASADQLPPRLPDTVLHSTYAPLGRLLPRAAGIVHHGGIGTCAQALRAGIFQLIKPVAFDQFDNAERLDALGVSRTLAGGQTSGRDFESAIQYLRESPNVKQRCAEVSRHMQGADGRVAIAELIGAMR
jgi:rhamnosyltransferase subunit B